VVSLSNFHYETDFGISSAEGAGNTKIGFIMRIAGKAILFAKS
jgi:hypothetical protein